MEAFSGSGQLVIGAELEVAVGPIGRSGSLAMHLGDGGLAPAYSYSHSRGAYAGLSLEGTLIFTRPRVNFQFYGSEHSPADILKGSLAPPRAAQPLYDALAHAFIALPFNAITLPE